MISSLNQRLPTAVNDSIFNNTIGPLLSSCRQWGNHQNNFNNINNNVIANLTSFLHSLNTQTLFGFSQIGSLSPQETELVLLFLSILFLVFVCWCDRIYSTRMARRARSRIAKPPRPRPRRHRQSQRLKVQRKPRIIEDPPGLKPNVKTVTFGVWNASGHQGDLVNKVGNLIKTSDKHRKYWRRYAYNYSILFEESKPLKMNLHPIEEEQEESPPVVIHRPSVRPLVRLRRRQARAKLIADVRAGLYQKLIRELRPQARRTVSDADGFEDADSFDGAGDTSALDEDPMEDTEPSSNDGSPSDGEESNGEDETTPPTNPTVPVPVSRTSTEDNLGSGWNGQVRYSRRVARQQQETGVVIDAIPGELGSGLTRTGRRFSRRVANRRCATVG